VCRAAAGLAAHRTIDVPHRARATDGVARLGRRLHNRDVDGAATGVGHGGVDASHGVRAERRMTVPGAYGRRLREVWRSAGWPYRDALEVELLAAGLLERRDDGQGRETLRVTDAGVLALAAAQRRNRAAYGAHEMLVERVAVEMQRAGRIVWRRLSLRAPVSGEVEGQTRWVIAMPDVYSIRRTTVEDYVEPVVHEIKVRRSDLLADLRRPEKGAAYRALASQCWYVLARGIAEADEVPDAYGVMHADGDRFEVARAAPRRAMRVPFAGWMALARANADPPQEDDGQALLGAPDR
jgi:hypothetical protein